MNKWKRFPLVRTPNHCYDPLLARVDHIYAKPESGLYMLYTDPDVRGDPLSFILVTTSLVVKTVEEQQLEIESTAAHIDGMKAFQTDPAYVKTKMSTQKVSGRSLYRT